MKRRIFIIAFIVIIIILLFLVFITGNKNVETIQNTTESNQIEQSTTKTVAEIPTEVLEYTTEETTQEEYSDAEKFNQIYECLKEEFGEKCAPLHYTKMGLEEELGISILSGSEILDCRNKDNSNILILFSVDSISNRKEIKEGLNIYNTDKNGIIYEINNYLFYIAFAEENEKVLNIIKEIIE